MKSVAESANDLLMGAVNETLHTVNRQVETRRLMNQIYSNHAVEDVFVGVMNKLSGEDPWS